MASVQVIIRPDGRHLRTRESLFDSWTTLEIFRGEDAAPRALAAFFAELVKTSDLPKLEAELEPEPEPERISADL